MRKSKWLMGVILFAVSFCFSATVYAKTDVYVGVSTVTKSNVHFLVVDEADEPIDDASIEIWANDKLQYQLLGVTQGGGLYQTYIPEGSHPHIVYKAGYQRAEGTLILPGQTIPHIEKVVLKKQSTSSDTSDDTNTGSGKNPNGNQSGGSAGNASGKANNSVQTSDSTNMLLYVVLLGMTSVIIAILALKNLVKKSAETHIE